MNLPSYPELPTIERLYPSPAVLLGRLLTWTEKRDGSNLRLAVVGGELAIASRHQDVASKEFQDRLRATGEADKVQALIQDQQKEYNIKLVVFGEMLLRGASPARFETHDTDEFVVFDAWDSDTEHFISYTLLYQHCYHYGLRVVERWGESRHTTMESLYAMRDSMLGVAKEKGREGVVVKAIVAYAKEKLDLPPRPRLRAIEEGSVVLPHLPNSELMGAVAKAHVDLGAQFRDKAIAMPLIARYVQEEQEKHLAGRPEKKLFVAYNEYLEGVDNLGAQVVG